MILDAVRVIWIGFYGWFFWTNLRMVISGLATGVITVDEKTAPIPRETEPDRFGRSLAWRSFLVVFALLLTIAPLVAMVIQPKGPEIMTSGSRATPPSP